MTLCKLDYIAFVAFVMLAIYILFLIRNSKNERWRITVLFGAAAIIVVGCKVHWDIFTTVSEKDESGWFSALWMSILSTLELFVGSTKMFDNGVKEVLYGGNGNPPQSGKLIVLTTVYIAAIITTIYLIGMFMFKHFYSRIWLKKKKNKPTYNDEVYVLFGMNLYARNLIKDLRGRHLNAKILAIDYLTEEEKNLDISLLERIRDLFSNGQTEMVDGADILLKAKRNLALADPADLCSSLGLNHLRPYLDSNANIYLLLDDQQENLAALNNLIEAQVKCSKIFCHARRDELNAEIEETFHNLKDKRRETEGEYIPEVVFIDSSFLSVRSMLRPTNDDYCALPVNYVEIAHDDNGQNLGYVETGFKAMILGFGETGQEALAYLYEYGAFVGKDKKKAPFECHVYDNNMNSILGYYSVSHPGMNQDEAGIYYHDTVIGSEEFWAVFESQIADANYIVVCAGSDLNNLNIVKHITQHLGQRDTTDKFRIMVKQSNPDGVMRKTLEFMSAKENNCIKPFGMVENIWREDVITDEKLTEMAEDYHLNYATANNEGKKTAEQLSDEWTDREKLIRATNTPRGKRLNEIRKRAQDYANCLHIPTKIKLMDGPLLKEAKSLAESIPGIYEGKMFTGDKNTEQIIEYMAIGEHLRWEASHVAMGYRRGKDGEPTNAEKKVHEYILDYTKLPPKIQHYDWVVIRTTLELYALKSNN